MILKTPDDSKDWDVGPFWRLMMVLGFFAGFTLSVVFGWPLDFRMGSIGVFLAVLVRMVFILFGGEYQIGVNGWLASFSAKIFLNRYRAWKGRG